MGNYTMPEAYKKNNFKIAQIKGIKYKIFKKIETDCTKSY